MSVPCRYILVQTHYGWLKFYLWLFSTSFGYKTFIFTIIIVYTLAAEGSPLFVTQMLQDHFFPFLLVCRACTWELLCNPNCGYIILTANKWVYGYCSHWRYLWSEYQILYKYGLSGFGLRWGGFYGYDTSHTKLLQRGGWSISFRISVRNE